MNIECADDEGAMHMLTFVWVSDVLTFLVASPVCVADVCMGM